MFYQTVLRCQIIYQLYTACLNNPKIKHITDSFLLDKTTDDEATFGVHITKTV